MRAAVGLVSLLVVLGGVGLAARTQMKVVDHAAVPGASPARPGAAASAGGARERAAQIEQRVSGEVRKTLEDADASRREAAEK